MDVKVNVATCIFPSIVRLESQTRSNQHDSKQKFNNGGIVSLERGGLSVVTFL